METESKGASMKYEFKQTMYLELPQEGNEPADSKHFSLGVHEVSKRLQKHWYFDHCLKAGLICEAGKEKEISNPPSSALEHAKILDAKIEAKLSKKSESAPSKKKG